MWGWGARGIWGNDDNSNSLESSFSVTWLSNSAPEDYTLAGWQVSSHKGHAGRLQCVTPACRQGRVSALLLQLRRGIYSTLSSPSIAFPCPAADPAHSFSSSGKEREQRRQTQGKVGARAVICERFLEKPEKLKMVPINGGKKVLGLTFILPPPVFILPFWPLHAFWEIWIKLKIFRLGNVM